VITKTNNGWAIKVLGNKYSEPFLCGRYWFLRGTPDKIPDSHMGYKISVFETRDKARQWRKSHVHWSKARVVKVKVTVREVE
jgi:hypothetical protein